MRCLTSLALTLLALKATFALAPASNLPGQVAVCPAFSSELSSSEEKPCAKPCQSDENCTQGAKCCARACGLTCVAPLIVPAPKAGHCPAVQAAQPTQPCLESTECTRDEHCKNHKKCCFSHCAMRCLDPTAEEPLQ
ncbi:whey acidic protein-like [Erinaceus europaeus]|uniref:Whey acidic protein-like n=1 Tax=Erinaceus europaeus TaxID=9365 RepID=A0A1S3WCZ1_ERIEU|nr:whey acidic protein-like [Erinaceus europaeus]